jgi:DNA-binding Lrp family transcriptional regulator
VTLVTAFVLISAEPGKATDIVKGVGKIQGVKMVNAVTGPYDAIAYIEAANFSAIGDLIVAKMQKVEGVSRTLTCVTVEL